MIDKEEVEAFVGEVDEIVENLRGIKGEMYTSGLFLLLNILNMNNMMSAMLGHRVSDEEAKRLDAMTNAVFSDTIIRVADLLQPIMNEEAREILCTALAKDASILVNKQNEYSSKEPT